MKRLARSALIVVALCGGSGCAAAALLATTELMADLGPASDQLTPIQQVPLAAYLWLNAGALDAPAGDPNASLELHVTEGATAQSVVDELVEARIVRNGLLLSSYLRYRGLDLSVQAGSYQVTGGMTVREVAAELQQAQPPEISLTIVEGWRLEQVAEAVGRAGLSYGEPEFLDAARSIPPDHPLAGELPGGASFEGFLFPDTYRLEPDGTAQDLVGAMLQTFQDRVTAELLQGFHAQGLILYEAVTLASIIEREAVVPEERPLIAGVFLRRLRSGLPLESDPTVQYALGRQETGEWWKAPLTVLDLELVSPYNTYRTIGLPPGPISNPGLASLQAVGVPAETSFLYFRAACDGSGRHSFAETFEQHLLNACP
jgi:UPF0755 protein